MKTKILFMLLLTTLCLSFVGCGKDDEKPKRKKVIDTWTFHYYKQYGKYLVGNKDKTPVNYVIWHESGSSFNIFFVQDGIITPGGTVDSNETELTEEQRTSIDLTYDVDVPPSIRSDNQYDYNVIAFSGVNTITDGNIVITTDLQRRPNLWLWDVGYTKKTGTDVEHNKYSKSLYTVERLAIKNKTGKTRMSQKGSKPN